jgi:hypothetical protein
MGSCIDLTANWGSTIVFAKKYLLIIIFFFSQLLNEDSVKEACEEHPICIFSFLPDILDSQAEGRNKYLNVLKELGSKYKKNMWGYV